MIVDYPEPIDAVHRCAYCGRRTRMPATISDSPYGDYTVAFKACCARDTCLDAAEVDPEYSVRYPRGHRPS